MIIYKNSDLDQLSHSWYCHSERAQNDTLCPKQAFVKTEYFSNSLFSIQSAHLLSARYNHKVHVLHHIHQA